MCSGFAIQQNWRPQPCWYLHWKPPPDGMNWLQQMLRFRQRFLPVRRSFKQFFHFRAAHVLAVLDQGLNVFFCWICQRIAFRLRDRTLCSRRFTDGQRRWLCMSSKIQQTTCHYRTRSDPTQRFFSAFFINAASFLQVALLPYFTPDFRSTAPTVLNRIRISSQGETFFT